ncbi:MAG: YihY/virulence factor BrkB family protein [Rhodothermales bacterium]|nr:YihY/virulence factor BrkB family protein [Rhodothermales bacterium]
MAHLKLLWRYIKALFQILEDRNGLLLAQAIGFKVLITIIPLAIFSTGILGGMLQNERVADTALDFVGGLIPGYLGEVTSFIERLQDSSGTFTWVGALGLLVSLWLILNSLETIVSTFIMGDMRERRPMLRRQLFVVQIMLQVGLAFLLTVALTAGIHAVNRSGLDLLHYIGLDQVWVESGWRRTINFLGLVIPYLLTMSMFFQLYFFIPRPHPPVRSALVGTVVAATLWELAKFLFTFYATRVDTFERYSGDAGESGVAALGDAFGLVLAIVVWAYYSGVVLIVGAITVQLHEKHGWGRLHIQSSSAA